MRSSTIRRTTAGVSVCATFAVMATLTGCDSGPTAAENFAGDLEAMGYKLDGNITSDQEKRSSLGLAPMAFELSASSRPRTRTDSKVGGGSSSSPKPQNTSTKAPKASTTSATSTTKATDTITILEAVVTIGGCKIQLERVASETDVVKTVGKSKVEVEDFWVDEVNGSDALGAPTNAPTVKAVKQYLANNSYDCVNG